ncbi:MAG: hypothetical protein ABFE08_18335 [Armatimonadia bacterium]
MKDPAVVNALEKVIIRRGPSPVHGTGTPAAKALLALGGIGTEEAKRVVLDTLQRALRRGPKTKRYIGRDGEYAGIIDHGLEALQAWPGDAAVTNLLQSLATEGKWYGRIDAFMQEKAWAVLLLHEMRRDDVTDTRDRARFLLKRLSASGEGHAWDWAHPGFKTSESARNGALMRLLSEMGPAIMPDIRKAQANDGDPLRIEALKQLSIRIKSLEATGGPFLNAPDK